MAAVAAILMTVGVGMAQAAGIGIAGWYAAGRAYRQTSADSTQYSGYIRDGDHPDGHCAYMEWKDQTGVWRETGFYNLGAGGSLGSIENPFVNCTETNKSWVRSGSATSYNDVTGLRMGVTSSSTKYVFCDTATECRSIPL